MFRIIFIAGLRDSEAKLKLLEALRANDYLTVEELLQFIQHRTEAKRYAESSVYQLTSSVVTCGEELVPNKEIGNQSSVDDVDESHSTHFMSALLRIKSVTIVRSKDATPDMQS